jgi:hypothetical protein
MQNKITEETINLARGVFIENRDGESIFTTKTGETWDDFCDRIFITPDSNGLRQSEQLLVRYFQETQPNSIKNI